jgi:dCTP deaminase
MILKSDKLADLLVAGQNPEASDPFVITPTPDLAGLRTDGSAAIDLRLGTWFTSLKQSRTPYLPVGQETAGSQLTKINYVPFDRDYILHPQNFVLAVTLEWLRIPKHMAAYVVGKSSWGRCGLIIATATGVHPGFKGCLTLELSNVGEIPIAVRPGITICQLFIHQVDAVNHDDVDRSKFAGLRRPLFKRIELDDYAKKLSTGSTGPSPFKN